MRLGKVDSFFLITTFHILFAGSQAVILFVIELWDVVSGRYVGTTLEFHSRGLNGCVATFRNAVNTCRDMQVLMGNITSDLPGLR